MSAFSKTVFIIVLAINCTNLFADPASNEIEFVIEGLKKTERAVVDTEIKICNCSSNTEVLRQKILSTGLFHTVSVSRRESNQILIAVEEKWTAIPILKFNSGGGVKQTTAGLYDPNLLGKRVELGAQYESIAEAPSVVLWSKSPRLLNSKFFLDLQYWDTNRIRLKYDQSANSPVLAKALLHESKKEYLGVGYEFLANLKSRLTFERHRDRFTTSYVPEETLNKVSGQVIPLPSEFFLLGTQVEWGRLDIAKHSPKGQLVTAFLKYGNSLLSHHSDFVSSRIEFLSYQHAANLIFANRVQMGSTNSKVLQYWNYLGGLESIRGFSDNRFAAAKFWLINSEIRKDFLTRPDYIIQGLTFADLTGIDEAGNKFHNLHAASIGAGVRLVLPKLYRVVMRLDFAEPILKEDEERISFGIQQFF